MKKRVKFAAGKQKEFFEYLKLDSNLTWRELANRLNVNKSTLSKAYMFGMCDVPYTVFKNILKIVDENEKEILEKYSAIVVEEKVVIGRKVLGEQKKRVSAISVVYKNGKLNLDTSRITFSRYDKEKNVKLPTKLTPELAEEIGMHYGDGFLSEKRYEYRLKGNPYNEKAYYLDYIRPLYRKLYNLDVSLKDFKTSYGFELKSKAIWEFKTKVIGIRPGNKVNLFVPESIKVNDVAILSSFLRGLFDTDGCISFKSKYGYNKYYPVIELTLISTKVIQEASNMLKMLGFDPKISPAGNYQRISLNGISQFKRYEELIGWSSPKNLNKVNEWKVKYPQLIKGYGECGLTVMTSDCGSLGEGSTPSFRPQTK